MNVRDTVTFFVVIVGAIALISGSSLSFGLSVPDAVKPLVPYMRTICKVSSVATFVLLTTRFLFDDVQQRVIVYAGLGSLLLTLLMMGALREMGSGYLSTAQGADGIRFFINGCTVIAAALFVANAIRYVRAQKKMPRGIFGGRPSRNDGW